MRTIFKYKLRPVVSLPKDSVILKTAIQNGEMFIWVLIYPDETEMVDRNFEIIGTGHSFEFDYLTHTYIDSLFDGPFVWHIWEINKN